MTPHRSPFTRAGRAFLHGCWTAARAPALLVLATVITFLSAVPFGIVLAGRLQIALAHQPAISLEAEEIDAEWWVAYRAQASGLERTFTPAIIGFAAPLDNLSALLDATPRPAVLILPIAIYALLWAFLWGGVLERFAGGRRSSPRQFVRDGVRHLPRFIAISAAAAAASLVLYYTLHPLLFGPLYNELAARSGTERNAFVARVALYIVFGAVLASIAVLADFTRVSSVAFPHAALRQALRSALAFVRRNAVAILAVYLLNAALLASLFALYGLVDRRWGGWRIVLVGQAFIVGRLAVRLALAGAEVALFAGDPVVAPQITSRGPENADPPAAM